MKNFNKMFKPSVLASLVLAASISLTACGGSSSSDDETSKASMSFSANDTSDLLVGAPYDITTTETKEITAKYGTVTKVDGSEDQWQYTFDTTNFKDHTLSLPIIEVFTLTDNDGKTARVGVSIDSKDELYKYQWHIYNDGKGKEYFGVTEDSVAGIDLNIIPAWNQLDSEGNHITGKNVVVAVLDSPVDFLHDDLTTQKITPSYQEDVRSGFINRELTVKMLQEDIGTAHGTAVSGIIGAAGNNLGVRGEAFDANLYNYSTHTSDPIFLALVNLVEGNEANLINASIGYDITARKDLVIQLLFNELYSANIPFVQSMGNEYNDTKICIQGYDACTYPSEETAPCIEYHTNCQFKQTDDMARLPYVIHVNAVNAQGTKSSYSSTGSSAWISGLGGEFSYSEYRNTTSAAIVSTLFSFSCTDVGSDWDSANSPWRTLIDPTCDYTAKMNGTSSAAPSITGIVALIKQVNNDFTGPQVKYILAKTARNDKIIPTFSYEPITVPTIDNSEITTDAGWLDNAAGMRFSDWYGFGLADAGAAVTLAKGCTDDEGCNLRKAMPIKIVSNNTANCTKDTDSNTDYTCTFTDLMLKDENDNLTPLTSNIEIEN